MKSRSNGTDGSSTSTSAPSSGSEVQAGHEQPHGNAAAAAGMGSLLGPSGGMLAAMESFFGPEEEVENTAKLHVYVDVDAEEIPIMDRETLTTLAKTGSLPDDHPLTKGAVGHTWIALEYNDLAQIPADLPPQHASLLKNGGKYADSMGFWPAKSYSDDFFDSYVDGKVKHPDTAHEGMEKASQSYEISDDEVRDVLKYADSKSGAKYSVFWYNCTTFAKEAVQAAGKSPPSMGIGAGICLPNAAYDGIKDQQESGVSGTMVDDLEGFDWDAKFEEMYSTPGQNPSANPTTEAREAGGHITRT